MNGMSRLHHFRADVDQHFQRMRRFLHLESQAAARQIVGGGGNQAAERAGGMSARVGGVEPADLRPPLAALHLQAFDASMFILALALVFFVVTVAVLATMPICRE